MCGVLLSVGLGAICHTISDIAGASNFWVGSRAPTPCMVNPPMRTTIASGLDCFLSPTYNILLGGHHNLAVAKTFFISDCFTTTANEYIAFSVTFGRWRMRFPPLKTWNGRQGLTVILFIVVKCSLYSIQTVENSVDWEQSVFFWIESKVYRGYIIEIISCIYTLTLKLEVALPRKKKK